MIGHLPADEDEIPPGNNIEGVLPFDFFGLGKIMQNNPENQDQEPEVEDNDPQQWDPWLANAIPDVAPAANLDNMQHEDLPDLNEPQQMDEMKIDDEEAPVLPDLNVVAEMEEDVVGLQLDLYLPAQQGVPLPEIEEVLPAQQEVQVQAQLPAMGDAEIQLFQIANQHHEGQGEAFLEFNDLLPQMLNGGRENNVPQNSLTVSAAPVGSASSASAEDGELNLLLDDVNQVILEQPQFGPFLPEDVGSTDLVGSNGQEASAGNMQMVLYQHPSITQHEATSANLHIGRMEFGNDIVMDPVLAPMHSIYEHRPVSADCIRLWAKYFSSGNTHGLSVKISKE